MKQLFLFVLLLGTNCLAEVPDWSEGFQVPPGGRNNPYQLAPADFEASRERGRLSATIYPVNVTGVLVPYRPIVNLLEQQESNAVFQIIKNFFKSVTEIKDFNSLLSWVGLHEYPRVTESGIYAVPYPNGERPNYLMGLSLVQRGGATGFTLSCAACHSANLFGKTILGMSNRFPRANRLFFKAKEVSHFASLELFQLSTGATDAETRMLGDSIKALPAIAAREPQQLGLDTSLAQVSLSLNLRADNPWADRDVESEMHPRSDVLDTEIADSKPAPWWNLKFKNRWLLDGSVVSGNPIFTNILWNEIGRGIDLHVLDSWFKQNSFVIQDLVTAVFSTEAPPITDFFDVSRIDIASARRGETLFSANCTECHGEYVKNWDQGIKTVEVKYVNHVKDVGTDSHRYLGMKSLEKLNRLQISIDNQTMIKSQTGYMPPPLVGIWARWPYFHNGSVPNLCALLNVGAKRPKIFFARDALDRNVDFDFSCNGYPTPQNLTDAQTLFKYDTSRPGLSNLGHDEGILSEDGQEKFSSQDKRDLISFLQTL